MPKAEVLVSQNDGGDLENLQIVFHNPNIEKYGIDSSNTELEYDSGLRNKGDNLRVSLRIILVKYVKRLTKGTKS